MKKIIIDRPVSILLNLSKTFKLCMYNQLNDYFDKILPKCLCGFRKGFSTQHYLLAMIEKLRKSLDGLRASAALPTDLSKAFNCLPHDRSSPLEVFFGKGVLKICSKFTAERPCRIAISIK